MCRYAAEQGATKAVINVEPENPASARVAQRVGFAYTERIREQDCTSLDRYERLLNAGDNGPRSGQGFRGTPEISSPAGCSDQTSPRVPAITRLGVTRACTWTTEDEFAALVQ